MESIEASPPFQPYVPFTFADYKIFMAEIDNLEKAWRRLDSRSQHPEISHIQEKIAFDYASRYLTKLPTYLLARCPICNGNVWEAIDTFSLTGPGWWHNESKGFGWLGMGESKNLKIKHFARPSYRTDCNHVRAVVYGVNLNHILTDELTYHKVFIGAEKPGLLAPLMTYPDSYAVIHTLPVGRQDDDTWQPRYTLYTITYFQPSYRIYRHSLGQDMNPYLFNKFYWPYQKLDYNLDPWLKQGKFRWLGPKADGLPLLAEPDHPYPYRALDGLTGRWSTATGGNLTLYPPHLVGKPLNNYTKLPMFKTYQISRNKALATTQFKSFKPKPAYYHPTKIPQVIWNCHRNRISPPAYLDLALAPNIVASETNLIPRYQAAYLLGQSTLPPTTIQDNHNLHLADLANIQLESVDQGLKIITPNTPNIILNKNGKVTFENLRGDLLEPESGPFEGRLIYKVKKPAGPYTICTWLPDKAVIISGENNLKIKVSLDGTIHKIPHLASLVFSKMHHPVFSKLWDKFQEVRQMPTDEQAPFINQLEEDIDLAYKLTDDLIQYPSLRILFEAYITAPPLKRAIRLNKLIESYTTFQPPDNS